MNKRRITRSVGALAIAGLVAAACGGDDDASDTTDASEATDAPDGTDASDATTEGTGGESEAVDLASVCPATIVIQTDWFPESEHGGLYEMVGEGYEVDTDKKVVTGPLVSGGEETGVEIEIRTGGPAIGYQAVSVQQHTDDSITLGYANTEGQVVRWADTPTISVLAPLEKNPQIIYWDPETYPEIETLADLGAENVTISIYEGGTFAEVFVGQGIWNADQVDGSYDGSPQRFIAEQDIAQQGFASAEPYNYENVFEDYGRELGYQLLHDAGFEVYSQTLSVRPDQLDELRPCLERFVPVAQQAQVDFINAPERANAIIIDAVEQFADFWTYDDGIAQFAVDTMRDLEIVANGPDDTLGNMDEDRVQTVIDQIRDDAGIDVPEDLVAADVFTNEFIDSSIGL